MESLVWSARPTLRKGVLVCAFYGWNDGGEAATTSALFLRQQLARSSSASSTPTSSTTSRKSARSSRSARTTRGAWPGPRTPSPTRSLPSGNDIAVMIGIEPQNRWKHYSRSVVEVARESGAELVVTLGGFLADTPHTRPGARDGVGRRRPRRSARPRALVLRGPDRHRRRRARRLQGGRHRRRRACGRRSRTTSRSRPTRRRRSRCSRGSRCCSTRASTPRSSRRRPSRSSARSRTRSRPTRRSAATCASSRAAPTSAPRTTPTRSRPPLLASGDDIAAQIERYLAEREESNEDS